MANTYVAFVSLVFWGLCLSGVTAFGSDEDVTADVTEATGDGVYGQDSVESPFLDLEQDVAGADVLPVYSHTGNAIDMADSKEQEALRVLEAPTTSSDENLGVDAVDFVESSMNQDETGESHLVSHGLRQNANGREASYLESYKGWHYYKVPVNGAMSSTNVKAACEASGYVTPCNGDSGCRYSSSSCVPTGLNNCGNPMYEISRALCGRSPPQCPQMYGVYQFMNNWRNGSACGAESGRWCHDISGWQDRYAFCARGLNVTTVAPVNTTTATQDPTTAPDEEPKCDRWTRWFDRDNPSGNGDYETLLHLRQENPGQICSTPSAIQARTRGSQVQASQTGEQFDYYDTVVGLACRNSKQPDRSCQDYEVRFCCPDRDVTTWTPAITTTATQGTTTALNEAPIYTDTAEWQEVFSTVKGTGQTVLDAWSAGAEAEVRHNKCPVVDHWESLSIQKVKVVLESNSHRNAELIFDGTNSDKFNWFSKRRLLSSPWYDLDTEPQNFFSIGGDLRSKRSFYINRNWHGCPNDAGWMVVTDEGPEGICSWERTPENNVPYILFSTSGSNVNFHNGNNVGQAERMVIYIETAGNNVLCSCPDGQALSENGTSCNVIDDSDVTTWTPAITTTATQGTTTAPNEATTGPVGLWPLNSQHGATDTTGNGNDGVARGTQLAEGPYGNANGAFLFSGTANSLIDIPNNGKLDVPFSYTILAHIYPTGRAGPIFNYVGNNNAWAVHLWQTAPTQLFMRTVGRNGYSSPYIRSYVLQQNAWNFVGGTYDSTTGVESIWNNAELAGQKRIGVQSVASQYPVRVAVRDGDSRYFAGRIACVQLYNYAMNKVQIAAARDTCKPLSPTPPADISASTTCTNDYMELSIPEDQLTDINLNNLHWEPDQNCGATTNGTHYIFRTELYGCGTQVTFGPKYVEFLNTIDILGIHFNSGVITRDSDISITSKCKYERQEWVDSTFLPIPGGLNFTEVGFGQLEVRLSMFPTRQYQRQYQANQYPIHLKLRQHVYMQLEVQGHGQKLSVLALNCKATMSPSPNDSLQYQLIRNGCASDPTLKIYDVNDHDKERFGFEAFRFIREVKMVYVHCEVLVCNAADSGSRCAQGCVNRGKRAAGEVDMRGRHMIYQGPIILDDDKEGANAVRLVNNQETGPVRRSAPWTMMAAGGALMALALVVMGVAMMLKLSRREKWAYQGLTDMEEDGE